MIYFCLLTHSLGLLRWAQCAFVEARQRLMPDLVCAFIIHMNVSACVMKHIFSAEHIQGGDYLLNKGVCVCMCGRQT